MNVVSIWKLGAAHTPQAVHWLLVAGLLAVGCQRGSPGELVCVASSIAPALAELLADNDEATLATASSGSLRAAIENGAPCGVFISASPIEVEELRERGMVVASAAILSNQLAVVTSRESAGSRRSTPSDALELLASSNRIAIGNPSAVPAGRYAWAWLEGAGLLSSVESRLVLTANARAATAAVESGSVDAGIVYKTDVAISGKVRVVEVIHEPSLGFGKIGPIRYEMALIGDADHPPDDWAEAMYQRLQSAAATRVFTKAGFLSLRSEDSPVGEF